MDLSPLIFVALAVAWAVYLIPQALKHHDEVTRSRSVDRFSERMRVLAHREPVSRRRSRLVVSPLRSSKRPAVETKARTSPAAPIQEVPDEVFAPVARPTAPGVVRGSARRAAARRRNVLGLILVVNAVVVGLAIAAVIAWPWVAAPVGLLVAWLVACRVSVRAERRARSRAASSGPGIESAIEVGQPPASPSVTPSVAPSGAPDATGEVPAVREPAPVKTPAAEAPAVLTGEIPVVRESRPGSWDMVPTTLPTYVTKPAAQRRTVHTIDLDSTGVWSSGRSDVDSALAREAEQVDKAAKAAGEDLDGRATGS